MPESYLSYLIFVYILVILLATVLLVVILTLLPVIDTLKPHKHKFSAKHEILTDAEHLKIYDRTHFKDVWWLITQIGMFRLSRKTV